MRGTADRGDTMKKQQVLRPLHAGMNDYYSDAELYDLCEKILFMKAKMMDTALLEEALLALDERPDNEVVLHRETVYAKILQRLQTSSTRPRRRLVMVFAILILSLLLVGCGLVIAHHIGVISFPSIVQSWLPWVESNEAESLLQNDLLAVTFEHSELRVREVSCDGHELRIVYSLRDLYEKAALSEQEQSASAIDAARLDGLGSCDYLVVDGQDVYLDDIFQLPGEATGEMLYYISAIIPGEMDLHGVISIRMPIGELDLETRTRYTAAFSIDTDLADVYALSAEPVTVQWDNLVVTVTRADFSPLHGVIEVHYSTVGRKPALYAFGASSIYFGQSARWICAVFCLWRHGRWAG